MNEYRKQQLQAAALIEQGATAEQVAAVYGWIRGEPEPIETGDKRTLTPRRKCGIIKAIKRHVRRWKRKQEGKTMRKLKVYLKTPYAFAVEIDGKEVYSTGKAKDIANYCERHFGVKIPTETRNYPTGTKTHFDGLTKNGFEFDIE